MITNPTLHEYHVSHQLSSVVSTQPVVAHKHESSFTSTIRNIPRYSYKSTKVAGKYTYGTITAHPIIAASTFIVALIAGVTLTYYHYKLCTNQEASHSIITESILILALVAALILSVDLTTYYYKLCTNQRASHPIIAASTFIVAAASIILILSLVACVGLITYHDKLCTNLEASI